MGCKDKGIRKFEFVLKTHFHYEFQFSFLTGGDERKLKDELFFKNDIGMKIIVSSIWNFGSTTANPENYMKD